MDSSDNSQEIIKSDSLSFSELWKDTKSISWNASTTTKSSPISIDPPFSDKTGNNSNFSCNGDASLMLTAFDLDLKCNTTEIERSCITGWIFDQLIDPNIGSFTVLRIIKKIKFRRPIGLYHFYNFIMNVLVFFGSALNKPTWLIQDYDLYENGHLFLEYVQKNTLSAPNTKLLKRILMNLKLNPATVMEIESQIQSPKRKQSADHPYFNVHIRQLLLRGVTKNTIKCYSRYHYTFLNWLINTYREFSLYEPNNVPLDDVKTNHLEEFKFHLYHLIDEGYYKEHTASDIYYEIRAAFTTLFNKGILRHWISKDLAAIDFNHYQYREIPIDEEIKSFIHTVIQYSPEADSHLLAYSLMLYLGLRGGEVATLKWMDVQMEAKSLIIIGENGYSDEMPIPSNILELLRKQHSAHPENEYVFHSVGKNYQQTLYLYFKLFTHIANWNYSGGLHLLRHTFVTRLSKHPSCTPQQLMKLARHRRPETTSIYIHRRENELKTAVNTIHII